MRYLLIFFLLIGLTTQAQIKFWNTDPVSNMPKFEVVWGEKTTIFSKVGGDVKPLYVFNKTAQQTFNGDGRTKYQMTVTSTDNVAKRTFQISYTHHRQTNNYLGYIKATYVYHDKRPTKVLEEYFETVKNP
ncbi:MAG: hypothetical protein KA215_02060 [Flavobacterium sp.]|jgi:hypothetical protein|nr:hypothetical protein [Flavobacterium sp.]HQV34944.1 hypothetical protein [Flavobacterium sp.]HQX02835.1 hypothetical protein [Flavobacterium sp.]